jgi:hypothetical protein
MVREFDNALPSSDPDVLVQTGFGDFPRVDLDAFTIASFLDDAEQPSFTSGTYASPDARFTISPTGCDGPDFGVGLALFPWDASATQFVSFGAECNSNDNPDAFAVSEEANIAVFVDGNGDVWVFDFVDARAGLD